MWPRVRGIWATALGNQRGPGHGPKHWHSITRCSTVSAVLGTDLFQATSSLSHNAWTLSAITRDHSQYMVWMGHLVSVGEEKDLCSKAVTLQLALWPVSSSLAYFIHQCRSNLEYHNSFSTENLPGQALPLTRTTPTTPTQQTQLSCTLFLPETFLQSLFNLPSVFMHCLG